MVLKSHRDRGHPLGTFRFPRRAKVRKCATALLAGREKGEETLAAGGGNGPDRFLRPEMTGWRASDFAVDSTGKWSKT